MSGKATIRNRLVLLFASIMTALLLTACGGTNVYKNDKTVVYNGAQYNLSKVRQVNSKINGKLSDTESVSLINADREQIETYLKEYDSIYVRMAFELDDKEMLYRASSVEQWSEYSQMLDSFEKAGDEITSLLASEKKMQLKLK